jgi:carbon-monoxide dehydrogenase iron sulfur subunit
MSQEPHYHIRPIPEKCRACRRCEVACIAANHGLTFKEALKHREEYVPRLQVIKREDFKISVRCRQCSPAPCATICPMGALRQENDDIIMRVQFCAGCKMCVQACPYGAINMESIGMPGDGDVTFAERANKTVPARCNLCKERHVEEGRRFPACVEACPAQALSVVGSDGSVLMPPPKAKQEQAEA